MSIGTPTAASATAGSGTSTLPTVNLPASIAAGSIALGCISTNSGSVTLSTSPTSSGWTQPTPESGNNPNIQSTTLEEWFFYKAVGPADSSTAFGGTLSGTGRWTCGVIVIPGATFDKVRANADAVSNTTPSTATITPTNNDSMLVSLGVMRAALTTSFTSTPASGFTEQIDNSTTEATSPNFGIWGWTKQLVGQGGSSQGAVSGTANQSESYVAFTAVVTPVNSPAFRRNPLRGLVHR